MLVMCTEYSTFSHPPVAGFAVFTTSMKFSIVLMNALTSDLLCENFAENYVQIAFWLTYI